MKKLVEVSIFGGCSEVVARAIKKFCSRWRPDSSRSKIDSVYRLLNRFVFPAWSIYADSLPLPYFASERRICKKLILSNYSSADGFRSLEQEIVTIHRSFLLGYRLTNKVEVDRELPEKGVGEFCATLDTLRALAYTCRNKQLLKEQAEFCKPFPSASDPRCKWGLAAAGDSERCTQPTERHAYRQGKNPPALSSGLRLSATFCTWHRHSLRMPSTPSEGDVGSEQSTPKEICLTPRRLHVEEFCRFCGRRTEFVANQEEEHSAGGIKRKPNARLSGRYCVEHRPKLHDANWNPDYLRGFRHKDEFETEVTRLQRQSEDNRSFRPRIRESPSDVFVRNLIGKLNLRRDEESDIRRVARDLLENKVTDRKKLIVMLRVSGWKQAAIAKVLGVSRQAVSKALKSMPNAYRFDIPQRHLELEFL